MKRLPLFRSFLMFVFIFFVKNVHAQDMTININNGSGNDLVCFGEEIFLQINDGISPYTIDWGDGNATSIESNATFYFYNAQGSYVLTVTDATGFSVSTDLIVIECQAFIFGNFNPCQGDCETYTADGGNIGSWQISDFTGNIIHQSTENPLQYCWDVSPGQYLLAFENGFSVTEEIVNVMGGNAPVNIVSLSNTFCVADSLNNSSSCDKICANTTAIYTLPGVGQNVEWEVLGAESYEANGNQVTVEWGAPGSGLVSATSFGDDIINNTLDVNCSSEVIFGIIGIDFRASATVTGGTPPYSYQWTGPNGFSVNSVDIDIPSFEQNETGEYIVIITDSNGEQGTCSVFLESSISTGGGCLITYAGNIQDASSCDVCDGSIDLVASGLGQNEFSFQWSNGTTTPILDGLCGGTYEVTITDGQNCEYVQSFTVGCNEPMTSCPTETSICVDILEDPEAMFSTIPSTSNGVVSICEGGTVVFNNESEGATIFEWHFGNGNISTSTNTEQTYPTAGTYEVYLISRNDCYCSDTTFLTIEVTDAISPSLDCVGTICEGQTVTYTTDADCGNYDWIVFGNFDLIDGGTNEDDFITIEWISGAEGIIQLDVADCSGGNFCLEPTVEVVPIISDDATIKGPEKVCRYDEVTYFINDYSATDFTWTISNGGNILEGQNTSSIKVKWDGPLSPNADQWVAVDYDNCYLGCGGSDTKEVYILPEMYIEGAIEACENEISIHTALKDISGPNNIDCDWTVTFGDDVVVWTSATPTNQVTLDWNTIGTGAGRYAIRAVPADPLESCTDHFTSYINLIEPPVAPISIGGPTEICIGEFYAFEVNSSTPEYQFNWEINDGGTITQQTGKVINVSFGNTPPYILSVTQTSTDGLACESEAISLEVNPIPDFTINGDTDVCVESEGSYTAQLFDKAIYDWQIQPADAGTVILGQNTNEVNIFWHQDGPATIEVTMCNLTEIFPVNIIAKPSPMVAGDLFICPGETTTVGTTATFDSYLWKTESGNPITNAPTVELPIGAYELVVTNSFGCEQNEAFEVVGFPQPEVSISVFGSRGRCYVGATPDAPAELHAMEVPAGYDYQWYFNNNPIANSNSSIITSSDFGSFYVGVIDQNGCETTSNQIFIFEYCLGGSGGGGVCNNPPPSDCGPGTEVSFDFTITSMCDVFDFQNTSSNAIPSTIAWDFGDPSSGSDNTSFDQNPSHEFSRPGYYIVSLEGNNGIEQCWDAQIITVPIKPNFSFGTACPNEPLNFEDLSGFLPGETISSWLWDFGDPTSGVDNTSTDQNPSHTFAAAGTYMVELTAMHTSGCTSTITKTVTIEEPPTITFDEPELNCQSTALSFIPQPSADVLFYDWNFGDPASGDANTSEVSHPFHAYENTGNYTVTCTVTDIWGCSNSSSRVITVEPNPLNGTISLSTPSPICDGDVTVMTAPLGGTSWEWSNGETTETITAGAADSYVVTVTNSMGCQYISPAIVLDVIALPTAVIQAVEYDEFGQPINVFYENYATCEGEDIFLQVTNQANYTYTWSDGTTGSQLEFSEDRDNLLPAGAYEIFLNILDNDTGCEDQVGPFNLVINPTPVDIQIAANPVGPVCENTLTTLTITNPDSDLTYVWNTGEMGLSIEVLAAGEYFARGITTFGCIGESNTIEILSGPDIKKIPDGCQSRCRPDTICLPTINGVSSYQWFLDGVAIAAPNGTTGDLVAMESGDYYVVMTDNFGCETTSDILTLNLIDGFGTFEGNVYMDVNENGIIDGPDTLVNNVDVILSENGMPLDTVTSANGGAYTFENILAADYNIQVDLTGQPANVIAVWNNLDTSLVGCDDLETVDWLLQVSCPMTTITLSETTCFGEDYIFDGAIVPLNTPTDFNYLDILGCDSVVTVTVIELADLNTTTSLTACDGNPVTYNNMTLSPGSTTEFSMISPEGCAYVETVEVIPFPINSLVVDLEVCAGEMAIFDGQEFAAGTQTELTYVGQNGCDSIVLIVVTSSPEIQYSIQTDAPCWNANDGIITINANSGAGPFEYSLDGLNYNNVNTFENLFAQDFVVRIRDANGCEIEEAISLEPIPQLEMQIITSELPCDGSDVVLQSQILSGNSNLTYEWNDGELTPELSVSEPGTYLLSVTSECETITEEARVVYENDGRDSYFFVPNAFSPNGDGQNDIFEVFPSNEIVIESFDFYVFDRWGNHIFDGHDVADNWDGKLANRMLNPGVYIWYIRANIISCGQRLEIFEEGDVTIMR